MRIQNQFIYCPGSSVQSNIASCSHSVGPGMDYNVLLRLHKSRCSASIVELEDSEELIEESEVK